MVVKASMELEKAKKRSYRDWGTANCYVQIKCGCGVEVQCKIVPECSDSGRPMPTFP